MLTKGAAAATGGVQDHPGSPWRRQVAPPTRTHSAATASRRSKNGSNISASGAAVAAVVALAIPAMPATPRGTRRVTASAPNLAPVPTVLSLH